MVHVVFNVERVWLGLEKLEDTKGVIRIRKPKDRQHNVQMKKDKSAKHYTEN
jgi:uncharacterized protein involved in tellurium resistance